jgi:hypothetical protein
MMVAGRKFDTVLSGMDLDLMVVVLYTAGTLPLEMLARVVVGVKMTILINGEV